MLDKSSENRHAVAAIVFESGRFLTIRRSNLVRAPGKVCFPGGHVEPGETEEDAVRREMIEELCIQCEPERVVWRSHTPWGTTVAWWTSIRANAIEPIAYPAEVGEVMWLSADEMLGHPDLLESNRVFLEMLERGEVRLD